MVFDHLWWLNADWSLEIQTSPCLTGLSCRHNTLGWSLCCLGRKELWDGWMQLHPQFPDTFTWLMGLECFGWVVPCSASAGRNFRIIYHRARTSPIFTTSWGTHLISSSNATACLSAPNQWRGASGFECLHWLASPATCGKSIWQSTAHDFSPSRLL